MRIHRDTCSAVKLIITATTKMGMKYKVGECRLPIESLTFDNQLGSILLPIHRIRKDESTSSIIGEVHLDIIKQPYSTKQESLTE